MLTERVDAALLDRRPEVRAVANMAVGYDNVDVDAATERGVPVTHTPGVLTETTADLAVAPLPAAARRLPEGRDAASGGPGGPGPRSAGAAARASTRTAIGAGSCGSTHGYAPWPTPNIRTRMPSV